MKVADTEGNVAITLHSVMSMPYTGGIYVDGVYVAGTGCHMGWGRPGKGQRLRGRIFLNMFTKAGKTVLASGSPSISRSEHIVQNPMNILDFWMDIEASVRRTFHAKFRTPYDNDRYGIQDGLIFTPYWTRPRRSQPMELGHGSFEGMFIDANGLARACGEPRRTAQAIAGGAKSPNF
ncbi:MAG TPA: hypothetical protein DCL66_14905 [Gammaproteobacteria bacterium]|nr:hypothetical protein [Gammaproteobacteria bacterium]